MTPFGATTTELLELARDGLPRPAIEIGLGLLASGHRVDEIIRDVLAPVQLEVGARWEANRWSIADEHAATAVIDGVLGALSFHTPIPDPPRGRVLVACAEGEHHTLPARMGAELLRDDGWAVTFLGGSLPADDLQRYAAVTEPDVVVISCTVPLFLVGARRSIAAVGALGLRTVAAGAAFGHDGVRARRLGAGGWIGPTESLTAALLDPHTTAEVAPTPPEAFALELAAEDLARGCLSAMGERMPQMAACSPAQLARTRADIGDILSHLVVSVDLGDDEIFTTFVEWLGRVLASRGLPPAVLEASLDVIGDVVAAAGMTEAARLCATRPATSSAN